MTGEFPAQRTSNAENVSIWWRHHGEVLKSGYIPIPTGTAVVSVWRRILKLAWEQLVNRLRIIQWKFRILYINVLFFTACFVHCTWNNCSSPFWEIANYIYTCIFIYHKQSWWSIEIRLHPDRHSSSIRVATNTKTRLGTIGIPLANYSVKVPHTVYQRLGYFYRLFCSLYVEQLLKSVLRDCKITYIRAYLLLRVHSQTSMVAPLKFIAKLHIYVHIHLP